MSADEFLTLAELAARLHLHKRTILRLVHAGELPHKRIGKQFRFRWRDIEAWWGTSDRPAEIPASRPVQSRHQTSPTDTSAAGISLVRGHKRCKSAPSVQQRN